MLTFQDLQTQQESWAAKNFPGERNAWQPLVGIAEEIGELATVMLKEVEEEEAWQPVTGWEGKYEVSDYGRVRRVGGGPGTRPDPILHPTMTPQGYLMVGLYDKQKQAPHMLVHCLVAQEWIGPRPPGFEVNHRDGHKANNTAWNLEYVTRSENQIHAIRIGLYQPASGEAASNVKLTAEQAQQIRHLYHQEGWRPKDLQLHFGLSKAGIRDVLTGRSWAADRTRPDRQAEFQRAFLRAQEACGRLAHAHLKQVQGIRGNPLHLAAQAQDALGDLLIFAADYASLRGWDLQEIVETTWAKVEKRDWVADPLRGGEDAPS